MKLLTLPKPLRFTLWAVAFFMAIPVAMFIAIVKPGGDGVLASLRLVDGSEYMVTQRCNWSGEPYTVAFYLKPAGGQWGWCYIDHQADRWARVSLIHDPATDRVTVTARGKKEAVLDRKTGKFWIAHFDRDVDAPQDYRTPEFAMR